MVGTALLCSGGKCGAWARAFANPTASSIRGLVLGERVLELLHDRVGIAAGLADAVAPLFRERLGRLLPFAKLRVGDGVDLVAGLGAHLGDAGVLEVGPR